MSKKYLYKDFEKFEEKKGYTSIHNSARRILERLYDYATWATPEEIEAEIVFIKDMLTYFEDSIVNTAKQVEVCQHDWGTPTYTIERRVLGNFVYVYKVECKTCGFRKSEQVDKEEDKPDWAVDAKQMYYNNFI